MNLNNVVPIYSRIDRAILLLDWHPEILPIGRRVAHQEVLDAMVQYINHDGFEGAIKINSMGKSYVLRMTQC